MQNLIIIAENLNMSIKKIREKIIARDKNFIKALVDKLIDCGVDYIDINAGIDPSSEKDFLWWIMDTVLEYKKVNISVDSSNPEILIHTIQKYASSTKLLINSVNLASEFSEVVIAGKEQGCDFVIMTMDNTNIPHSFSDRLSFAEKIIEFTSTNNLTFDRFYIDFMVKAVATESGQIKELLSSIKEIKQRYEKINTIMGVSNVSFGLPGRRYINRALAILGRYFGNNAFIIDPLDKELLLYFKISDALAGKDEFCMNYLECYRRLFS